MTHPARRRSARDLITELVDPASFRSWDTPPAQPRVSAGYAAELREAGRRSGADEALLTGEATLSGHRVALIVSEFGFLGGTVGEAAARRILAAVRRATAERLPLLAAPASGGTRMQEGTPAFVTIISLARAVREHKDAGLLYAVYLRHPTTGGVMASWGSLGQITFAEPAALLGFLGPKVYRALHGQDFPRGIQTAENLHRRGLVDHVVTPAGLRNRLSAALHILAASPSDRGTRGARPTEIPPPPPGPVDSWACVEATRQPDRAGLREFLRDAVTTAVPLNGTGAGERDPSLYVGLASVRGTACVVIGHDREAERCGARMGPAGFRQAQRGIRLAADLRLPVLTVVDTAGAELSPAAEEGGLAAEIARCIEALGAHPYGTVSVLFGQGTGGGALALFAADTVIAAERAWLSPLPPEGASAIVHGAPDHAPLMARSQRISALELRDWGIVHSVISEGHAEWMLDLAGAVGHALRLADAAPPQRSGG